MPSLTYVYIYFYFTPSEASEASTSVAQTILDKICLEMLLVFSHISFQYNL